MTARARLNLVLGVIVAALVTFIALAPENEAPVELERLSSEDSRGVSHVRLHLDSGATIELRRTDEGWRLTEPIRAAANAFRVDTLLTVLGAPVHTLIDAPPETLSRYGLEPPRARLELDQVEILFGDTEPIHGRRYLLYDGRVALVDDAYFSHLASSAANYVDPALLGTNAVAKRIELPRMTLYRDGNGHGDGDGDGDGWRRETPGSDGGDIEHVVEAWRSAQATAVRPYEPSLEWNDSIRIELEEGPLTFDLARTEYEIILGRRDLGIQYHMTKGAGARLLGEGGKNAS